MAGERILVVDIGNSSTKWAVYREPVEGFAPFSAIVKGRWNAGGPDGPSLDGIPLDGVGRAVVISVVPSRTAPFVEYLERANAGPILVVTADLVLPFAMGYSTPGTLGADRIAAAAGAVGSDPGPTDVPVLVVDAGSALTVDLVDGSRCYRGGAIAPGPALLVASLRAGTAQLPDVETRLPESPVGRSTDEAIRSGVMVGFVSAFEGIVRRMRVEAGPGCRIVATGGWSSLLAAETGLIDLVVPDLVLRGGAVLAGLNR